MDSSLHIQYSTTWFQKLVRHLLVPTGSMVIAPYCVMRWWRWGWGWILGHLGQLLLHTAPRPRLTFAAFHTFSCHFLAGVLGAREERAGDVFESRFIIHGSWLKPSHARLTFSKGSFFLPMGPGNFPLIFPHFVGVAPAKRECSSAGGCHLWPWRAYQVHQVKTLHSGCCKSSGRFKKKTCVEGFLPCETPKACCSTLFL